MFFLISGLKKTANILKASIVQHLALGLMPTPEKQIHLFNYGLSAF